MADVIDFAAARGEREKQKSIASAKTESLNAGFVPGDLPENSVRPSILGQAPSLDEALAKLRLATAKLQALASTLAAGRRAELIAFAKEGAPPESPQ